MPDTQNITYLITDDDPDDQEFIADALLKHNVKGTFKNFGNGAALLEYLELNPESKNIILLDLNMPVLNGYETLRKINSSKKLQHNIIFVLTSSIKREDEKLCLELGCDAFFKKPISAGDYDILAKSIINLGEDKS